jgi:NACHT domain
LSCLVSILETLGKYNVTGATYDSSQREYAPSCLPNTRLDVMGKIWEWVSNNDGCPIYWLTGVAGSGKSTIAQTFAKDCADENKLAASFFFSKESAQCSSISKIILTLAYQLAISVPSAQGLINEALQADPSIPDKNLAVQFTKLVYRPILALEHPISPMIVIIDALDECEDKGGVAKLIEIITGAFREERTFCLRFFFTSRAEDYITAKFAEPQTRLKTSRLALEDFKRFDETEGDEIARLSPHDLVCL